MVIIEIETKKGDEIVVDKLNNGNYCITVNGKMTQKDLGADEVIRWFGNFCMN